MIFSTERGGRVIAISLQSGSNGNCIYVEADGKRLLFDAGISGKKAAERLTTAGIDIRAIDAVVISHDHADHVACAGVYQRQYGLPVHATRETLYVARGRFSLNGLTAVEHFEAGNSLAFGNIVVHTIPTPHDCADGVGFVVEAEGKRLGILTDLGHVFDPLREVVSTLDAVFMESNYDPGMLDGGTYPEFLKRRIRGDGGHLSNQEAAELIRESAGSRLRWVCLAHLSEHNNNPALALKTHRRILGPEVPILVAGRYSRTDVLTV